VRFDGDTGRRRPLDRYLARTDKIAVAAITKLERGSK
jgi:hypothetical protein